MNREHPSCTERQSLTQECGWKDGDRGGFSEGQELTGKKRRTKTSLQERKKRKTHLTHTGLLMEGVSLKLGEANIATWLRQAGIDLEKKPSNVLVVLVAIICRSASNGLAVRKASASTQ